MLLHVMVSTRCNARSVSLVSHEESKILGILQQYQRVCELQLMCET
jgi:hypothetical protein